jgi:hypothetical protein
MRRGIPFTTFIFPSLGRGNTAASPERHGRFRLTTVMFRSGRIIGLSSTVRYIQQDTSERAIELARVLERRIALVAVNPDP